MQGSFVDDLATGTSAALAGGVTTVGTFAYPGDGENVLQAMDRCLAEVGASAIGDVFFHGFTWPPSRELAAMMPELAARGQPSHKIFMTQSDFGQHRSALIEVLEAARAAGVVTLMHCEDGAMLDAGVCVGRVERRSATTPRADPRSPRSRLPRTPLFCVS